VLNYLRRRAQLRGVVGGSRGWTILWVVLMGGRLLRRVTSDKPEVVFTRKLRPGEALVIRAEKTTAAESPQG
jgi:hypothetical protein